ncbi:MAG: DinB family protein [Dehalococcoidia bacterium]
MDPFVASARYNLKQSIEDYRRSLDGLDADALNWRPAGDEINSMAVLTFHAWSSTRSWLSIALGAPLAERDRDAEFLTSTTNAEELREWFEDMAKQCDALLSTRDAIDWAAMRKTRTRPGPGDPQEVPPAFALLHGMEHLREHEGQLSLTRQLWEAGR